MDTVWYNFGVCLGRARRCVRRRARALPWARMGALFRLVAIPAVLLVLISLAPMLYSGTGLRAMGIVLWGVFNPRENLEPMFDSLMQAAPPLGSVDALQIAVVALCGVYMALELTCTLASLAGRTSWAGRWRSSALYRRLSRLSVYLISLSLVSGSFFCSFQDGYVVGVPEAERMQTIAEWLCFTGAGVLAWAIAARGAAVLSRERAVHSFLYSRLPFKPIRKVFVFLRRHGGEDTFSFWIALLAGQVAIVAMVGVSAFVAYMASVMFMGLLCIYIFIRLLPYVMLYAAISSRN